AKAHSAPHIGRRTIRRHDTRADGLAISDGEPVMMIMDAGVHVWRPEAPDRPWMPGRKAHLPEPLTYEKFGAMMQKAGVEHAILVPPSWEGAPVDYILEAG